MRLVHNSLALFGMMAAGLLCAHSASAQTLLSDNFNSENGGSPTLNYSAFSNFTVVSGSVDLIGSGYFDLYPGNGYYIDLDGTTNQGGTLQSKTNFTLTAGTYLLQFDLGGSQRGDSNQVNVSLGTVFSESFVRASSDPLAAVVRTIVVGADTTGFLSFQNTGGDNVGAILDNVSLVRQAPSSVPEPGSLALLMGVVSTGGIFVRRRKAKIRG